MKKLIIIALTFAFINPANATVCEWCKPPPKVPPPKPPAAQSQKGVGVGPWIAGGIIGCGAIGLMAGAAYKGKTQHRELTLREAHGIVWGCAIPVVGYFLSEALWNANPAWEQYNH